MPSTNFGTASATQQPQNLTKQLQGHTSAIPRLTVFDASNLKTSIKQNVQNAFPIRPRDAQSRLGTRLRHTSCAHFSGHSHLTDHSRRLHHRLDISCAYQSSPSPSDPTSPPASSQSLLDSTSWPDSCCSAQMLANSQLQSHASGMNKSASSPSGRSVWILFR